MDTQTYIQEAFYHLCKSKSPHKISINAIIEKAGINRSTFYYYYEDKEDFIEKIQTDVLDAYFRILRNQPPYNSWINEHFSQFDYPAIYANCHYVETKQHIFKVWSNDLDFINKFTGMLIGYFKEYTENETRCIFLAYGTIGYIRHWVNNERLMPFEEVAATTIRMAKQTLAVW